MKKFFKFLGSAALICGTIAGGIFAYKKFFAADPFDDDLEDDFDDDLEEIEASERGYVSLSPSEDTAEEAETEEEKTAEETEEAVKEEAAEE